MKYTTRTDRTRQLLGLLHSMVSIWIVACLLLLPMISPAQESQPFWTWMSGSDQLEQNGIYGIPGAPDPANVPGARQDSVAWVGSDGSFWLFGGSGRAAANTSNEDLNDLWRYNVESGEWTWISGSSDPNAVGVHGTQGVAHADNVPGARRDAVSWTGNDGRLWLFGGERSFGEFRGDLWVFDPATGLWTWVNGPEQSNQYGVYGELGTADAANHPGARTNAVGSVDNDGIFWLFGGVGYAADQGPDRLNDLWSYDPQANEWTWRAGSDEINHSGVYGTQGVAAPANTPGARDGMGAWTAQDGTFWLYSGVGRNASGVFTTLADLWKFDPVTTQWTWVRGVGSAANPNHGELGVPHPDNTPGRRQNYVAWTDAEGIFWFAGGFANGPYNDVWRLDPETALWTWMLGSDEAFQTGNYGTKGVPQGGNIAGSRSRSVAWTAQDGTIWLFGGDGYATQPSPSGVLNDLWKLPTTDYQPVFFDLTYTATPGGSLTGETVQEVLLGLDGTPVQAVPDPGFKFVQWSDGSTDNPRIDQQITDHITVEAIFQIIPGDLWIMVE